MPEVRLGVGGQGEGPEEVPRVRDVRLGEALQVQDVQGRGAPAEEEEGEVRAIRRRRDAVKWRCSTDRVEVEVSHSRTRKAGQRWCVRWKTRVMRASSFWYFKSYREAADAAERVLYP